MRNVFFLIAILCYFFSFSQSNDCSSIDILIFQTTGQEQATENAINQYQNMNPLSEAEINISTEIIADQEICNSMESLLEEKEVVLFLGGSLLENCNWIDIIPQLDDFMRNGGEVIIQAHNSFDFINTSNWPNYSNDYISQEEELEWFLDIGWNQYGVFSGPRMAAGSHYSVW